MEEYTAETAKRVWLISDTHFDHANIIRYCNRPFPSVQAMNRAMFNNWNNIIASNDLVYFLGDMSFGRHSRKEGFWLSRLNGRKVFIRGSHDQRVKNGGNNVLKISDKEVIQIEGVLFLLIHDAFSPAVNDWDGWIIHGHSHNNRPFLDSKKINVSVEVINYKPISLYEILQRIKSA